MATVRPADAEAVWRGGLRWIEAAFMQAERFEGALFELQHGLIDATMRAKCSDPANAWRISYDRDHSPYDPQRPIRVPTFALQMQVASELDFLIVAVRNVLRCQVRIPVGVQSPMTDQDVLELLRNVGEHWDEVGGRSAEELAKSYPSAGAVAFTNEEIWIGGVPVSRIRAWLARTNEAVLLLLKSAGMTVPGDMDSVVEDDDALPWPADRRRYRLWMVPMVEIEDWPTEEMPADVETALHELQSHRFRSLRERDGVD